VKWLVTVKIVCRSPQLLSDRRASGSARFLTLLFALHEGDTWSPAHGAVRWVRGAISLAALDSGQTWGRAHRTRDWEPGWTMAWNSSWT